MRDISDSVLDKVVQRSWQSLPEKDSPVTISSASGIHVVVRIVFQERTSSLRRAEVVSENDVAHRRARSVLATRNIAGNRSARS